MKRRWMMWTMAGLSVATVVGVASWSLAQAGPGPEELALDEVLPGSPGHPGGPGEPGPAGAEEGRGPGDAQGAATRPAGMGGMPGMGPRGPLDDGDEPGMGDWGPRRMGRGEGRGMMWRRPGPTVLENEQDVAGVLGVVKDLDPELAGKLGAEAQGTDAKDFGKKLGRHLPGLLRLAELKKDRPGVYEVVTADLRLRRRTEQLARQYGEAVTAGDATRAAEIEGQLRAAVTEQFDVRQKMREGMVAEMQARVERMRQRLAERAANRERLIEERVGEMMESRAVEQ